MYFFKQTPPLHLEILVFPQGSRVPLLGITGQRHREILSLEKCSNINPQQGRPINLPFGMFAEFISSHCFWKECRGRWATKSLIN